MVKEPSAWVARAWGPEWERSGIGVERQDLRWT